MSGVAHRERLSQPIAHDRPTPSCRSQHTSQTTELLYKEAAGRKWNCLYAGEKLTRSAINVIQGFGKYGRMLSRSMPYASSL